MQELLVDYGGKYFAKDASDDSDMHESDEEFEVSTAHDDDDTQPYPCASASASASPSPSFLTLAPIYQPYPHLNPTNPFPSQTLSQS